MLETVSNRRKEPRTGELREMCAAPRSRKRSSPRPPAWIVRFPEAEGPPFANVYARALESQRTVLLEDCYRPWGRWFENRIDPTKDGLSVFFTEITERKRNETLLAIEKQVLEMITSDTSLSDVLERIVLGIETLSRDAIASILLPDPDDIHVHCRAAPHLPDAYK